MVEARIDEVQFGAITQIIGVAYTYRISLAVRRKLTRKVSAHHSSQLGSFSYFYKGDANSVARTGEDVHLRRDIVTGRAAKHWPEPELAAFLGERHKIIAYTLANDLTAITFETLGRTQDFDGTYWGKVWFRSGSLGPRFVAASRIGDTSNLLIGLRVVRRGVIVYDQTYNTSRRLRAFDEIPDAIVSYRRDLGMNLPRSKQILVGSEGFLPRGTVIMLGTGIIVQERYFCEQGDVTTVYSPAIGELTNTVSGPEDFSGGTSKPSALV